MYNGKLIEKINLGIINMSYYQLKKYVPPKNNSFKLLAIFLINTTVF